ncbi:putative multidrug resistance protein 4 [Lyophyllum shimeji]|uniref:Multidrug resistance protein 4 n=1 Tax=Lyophyllum shimeji TaxID=47721 RepID=A0A9P3PSM0_LYOSH|nr:putative multidrug resistance protein 4 [Lyophyllum shimeji]
MPPSIASSSSVTVQLEKVASHAEEGSLPPGHDDSALPKDKEKVEQAVENVEDDWENDPENARNWSFGKKWTAVSVVSLYTFCSPLASSMMAPGLEEYLPALLALGPLFLAPLSEMYGRTWVLHFGNLFSLAFTLGCAFAPDVGSLIGFRFLAGLSGSAPVACGGGSIGDLFSERDRASAMAVLSLAHSRRFHRADGRDQVGVHRHRLPVCGGCDWHTLAQGNYGPVIRLRRARRSGDVEALRRITEVSSLPENKLAFLLENLTRPMVMLSRSFICFILSLYMAFLYGIYYLFFATFAEFFRVTYGFKPGVGGLAYLGLGIGFILATLFGAKTADQVYKYLADKNGGKGKPEMRIPALFFGSFFVPIGLFWYGWSAQAKIHWIMPIIGSGIFGFGMMSSFLPIQLYLVDAFRFAASATAAASVFRSLLGFAFPLFGQQMFHALGLGGGNSLLAGLAIILGIPFPVWIYYRGEAIRVNSKVQL